MDPFEFDQSFGQLVAGVDEVGRGALAGPLVSAAVLLDYASLNPSILSGVADSKKLTREKREELYPLILKFARQVAIVEKSVARIDEINIHWADLEANHEALVELSGHGITYLADGFNLPAVGGNSVHRIVKGDAKSAAIGAASIVAKVHRDRLMAELALLHPSYGWATNVGYSTRDHWAAIETHGITPHHRLSFPTLRTYRPDQPPLF